MKGGQVIPQAITWGMRSKGYEGDFDVKALMSSCKNFEPDSDVQLSLEPNGRWCAKLNRIWARGDCAEEALTKLWLLLQHKHAPPEPLGYGTRRMSGA